MGSAFFQKAPTCRHSPCRKAISVSPRWSWSSLKQAHLSLQGSGLAGRLYGRSAPDLHEEMRTQRAVKNHQGERTTVLPCRRPTDCSWHQLWVLLGLRQCRSVYLTSASSHTSKERKKTHKWLAKSIIWMLYNLLYTNPKLSNSQMGTVPRNKVIGKKEAEF